MNRRCQFSVEEIRCPYCDEPTRFGSNVCRGCQSEIVYGATRQERSDYRLGMFVLGLILAAFFFTHIWWAYPLIGFVTLVLLSPVDIHSGEVRYFRHLRYN